MAILKTSGRSPVNDRTKTLQYQFKFFTVNYSKILKEHFISKHFSFPDYMKYLIKTHLCLKITINGHKVFLDCSLDMRLVFAAVRVLCPKYYNFSKTLSPSQDLKSFDFL